MNFKKISAFLLALICLSISIDSYAFVVDKMVVISDEKGNGILTLTNDENSPIFINSEIEELNINSKGDILKEKYSRDNLEKWKISLTHQKLVLNPGEEKDIGIRSLCYNTSCDDSKDLMFMLSFTPSKYQPGDEVSGIDINYGFAPVYIIPTSNPHYSYKIVNEGSKLIVENDSNTLINVFVDSCNANKTKNCKQKFIIVAGRHKKFNLPESMRSDKLKITVTSYDRSYSKKETVVKGKVDA